MTSRDDDHDQIDDDENTEARRTPHAAPDPEVQDGDDIDNDMDIARPLVLTCNSASTVLWGWIFAIFIASAAGYSVYSMTRGPLDWQRDWPILAAFLIVLPAFAVLILIVTVWVTIRWRKQGATRLHVPDGVIVEGRRLRGFVECSRTLELIRPAHALLECLETRTVRKDGESCNETRVALEQRFPLEPAKRVISARNRAAGDGTRFELDIPIPELRRTSEAAPKATGVVSSAARVNWRLTIVAPVRGIDHESQFDLIVLTRAQASGED